MIWTPNTVGIAAKLKENYTYRDAAALLSRELGESISPEMLRSAIRRRTTDNVSINSTHDSAYDFQPAPMPDEPDFSAPLRLESSSVLVLADLHTPYHNAAMLERAMSTASDVEDVIIAGDLVDFSSVSIHPANEYRSPISRDLDTAGNVLSYIASHRNVRRIFIMSGNHDERLARRAGANFTLRHLVNAAIGQRHLEADVITTEYDYIEYNDSWLIGHLSTYSRRPGEAARRIAEARRRNVAVGHDHIQGYTSTMDGNYIAISIGAMVDHRNGQTPFWYKERRLNDMPPTSVGFLIISGDTPYLFNEHGLSSLNGGTSWESIDRGMRRIG